MWLRRQWVKHNSIDKWLPKACFYERVNGRTNLIAYVQLNATADTITTSLHIFQSRSYSIIAQKQDFTRWYICYPRQKRNLAKVKVVRPVSNVELLVCRELSTRELSIWEARRLNQFVQCRACTHQHNKNSLELGQEFLSQMKDSKPFTARTLKTMFHLLQFQLATGAFAFWACFVDKEHAH